MLMLSDHGPALSGQWLSELLPWSEGETQAREIVSEAWVSDDGHRCILMPARESSMAFSQLLPKWRTIDVGPQTDTGLRRRFRALAVATGGAADSRGFRPVQRPDRRGASSGRPASQHRSPLFWRGRQAVPSCPAKNPNSLVEGSDTASWRSLATIVGQGEAWSSLLFALALLNLISAWTNRSLQHWMHGIPCKP